MSRNDMTIAREEIFGPVLSVIEFETEEEAVAIANDTPYGLAASLYTEDLNVAHRVARELRAGVVGVNAYSEGDMTTPFGGYKLSGFGGHDKSVHAHDQYTETKTIWIQLRSRPSASRARGRSSARVPGPALVLGSSPGTCDVHWSGSHARLERVTFTAATRGLCWDTSRSTRRVPGREACEWTVCVPPGPTERSSEPRAFHTGRAGTPRNAR